MDEPSRKQPQPGPPQRRLETLESALARKSEQLREALDTLRAIRSGQVDAVVVRSEAEGERIFTLEGADRPYRVIVETMNEAAATVTPDGLILYANQRLAGLLRLPLSDIAGQRLRRFVAPRYRRSLATLLTRSRAGRLRRRLLLRTANGRDLPAYVSSSSLQDPGMPQPIICLVITDLTKLEAASDRLRQAYARQTALEASEHYWRQMAEAIPQLIWTSQADGSVDYCSSRWIEATGRSLERTREDGWLAAVQAADRARAAGTWTRAVQGGRELQVEARLDQAAGGPRWFLVRAVPLKDEQGHIFKWLGTCTDIDDRRRAEEALRSMNEELERRVAQRTAEADRRASQLRALAAELTNVEQTERQRLAQVLHDGLQQLLVAAKYGIEALRGRAPARAQAAGAMVAQQATSALDRRIEALDDLLTQSLQASRSLTMELSPPALQEGDFAAVLRWLARWMQEKHGLEVEVEIEEGVEIPESDLRILLFQAARELLFNVAKHAGVQRARIELHAGPGNGLRVRVSDRGRGFDPGGERVSDSTFGLFSLRERLQLLQGRLEIRSAPGEGTRVDLLVPRRARARVTAATISPPSRSAHPPAVAPDLPARGPGRHLNVVLADDHEIVRRGVLGLLKEAPDIEVVAEAGNGQEAVELARALRPDVIIMDVSMPVLDGIEATRLIKSDLPDTRVVALSMHAHADMAEQMRQAGACCYVTKGGPSQVLLAAVRGEEPAAAGGRGGGDDGDGSSPPGTQGKPGGTPGGAPS